LYPSDSGATHTFVPLQHCYSHGIQYLPANCSLANDMNVAIQGYIDVIIKLRPLRRKHRALVIDLRSIDAVWGMDFMARHDVTISCEQRTLSFPTATGTACFKAYHNMDSLPRCNSFAHCQLLQTASRTRLHLNLSRWY
jgi:hypothetical protein